MVKRGSSARCRALQILRFRSAIHRKRHTVDPFDQPFSLLFIPITIGDQGYMEGQDFTNEEFYNILLESKTVPCTSHIPAPMFHEIFEQAYNDGCQEFDMVIAVGALKEGRYDYVRNDIEAVVKAAKGRCVKVIIETAYLTDEEKIMACKLCTEAGATFVKTCTGFSNATDAPNAATVHDIELMRANIAPEMKVKASSGIKTFADADALIKAGAERLGTSSGAAILAGAEEAAK